MLNGDSNTAGSVKKAIADLIGSAPEAYDTLKEIADYIASDKNAGAALTKAISNETVRAEGAENTLQQNITAEKNRAEGAESVLRGLIDGITENIENGYMYAGIATPSSTPATGKVFYLALTAGTYTNFGNTEVSQGINILKYNGSAWSLDAFISIDENANIGGNGVVKGNGIATELLKLGINTLGWTKNEINYSTGAISPNNDRRLSELVPIINECLIQIEDVETITSAYGIVWYNEDKEFISGIGWQSSLVYDITSNAPSSAKYFRIFVNATEISSDNVFVFTTGSLLYNYMVDELNGATETEAGQRQSGDSTLSGMINSETQRAQQAEGELGQRITQETQRAQGVEQTIDGKASKALREITNLEIEDSTLSGMINSETQRAQQANCEIKNKKDVLFFNTTAISGNDGKDVFNTKRLSTGFMPLNKSIEILLKADYRCRYYYLYDVDFNLLHYGRFTETHYMYNPENSQYSGVSGAKYIRIVFEHIVGGEDVDFTTQDIFDIFRVFDSLEPNIYGVWEIATRLDKGLLRYNADGSKSFIVDVSNVETVNFIPDGSHGVSYYCFLKSFTEFSTTPDYATGYSGYGVQVTTTPAIVPSDAKYLIVLTNVGGNSDRTPKSIILDNSFDVLGNLKDNFESFYRNIGDIKLSADNANNTALDAQNVISHTEKSFRVEGSKYIRSDGSKSFLISVDDKSKVYFEPSAGTSYYLFVKSYSDEDTTPDYATGYSSYGVQVTKGYVDVPSDAKYLIVLTNVRGNSDRTPKIIRFGNISIYEQVKNIILHPVNYEIKQFRIIKGGGTDGVYNRTDNSKSALIPISSIDSVYFVPGINNSYYTFVKSYSDEDTTPDHATGYSNYGKEVSLGYVDVPSDANYLIVLLNVAGSSDRMPQKILINGVDINKNILQNIGNNRLDIEEINDKLKTIGFNGKSNAEIIAESSGYANGELTWLSIGDSFTEINDTTNSTIRNRIEKGYQDRIIEMIPQLSLTNIGHSGTTFIDRASNLNEITAGYDLYTVMFGTNDWSHSVNWGTRQDFTNRTTGTSLGSLGKIIDKIKSVAPNAVLIVANQMHRGVGIVPGATVITARNHDSYLPNNNGQYLADMEEDIIECCKLENIEYVDIFKESGVTPRNACKYAKVNTGSQWEYLRYPDFLQYIQYDVETQNPYDETTLWATYDGCHPSKYGMQIIANLLGNKIKELLFK